MDIYTLSDSVIQKKIGERLRMLRLRQDITQMHLTEETQVSVSSIKKIEKGEIGSFESFIRVLRILGKLDIFQSLTEEEPMSPNEYYEFINSAKKRMRQRASKTRIVNNTESKESEW